MRVLFILPGSGGGGGAHSVIQECVGLQRLGIRADIATTRKSLSQFSFNYPELEQRRITIHPFADSSELAQAVGSYDLACATTWESVYLLAEARAVARPAVKTAYYVQDYEPLFCAPGSFDWERSRRSYTEIPDAVMFAKTQFLCDIVTRNHAKPVARVKASIDHDTYFVGQARRSEEVVISAMLRPKTLRRAPRRHVRILEMLADQFGQGVQLVSFGCPPEQLVNAGIRLSDRIEHRGSLSRKEVAGVLRSSDLFLDLSDYQAFGRTGLEGMACGCVPILPVFGGASEYLDHWRNGFLVDTRFDTEIIRTVAAYLDLSAGVRARMRLAAIETALNYTVDKAAFSELKLFEEILS